MIARLELRLPPDWDTVKGTWDACTQHLTQNGLNSDESYSLCMTAQELLENAVKYGSFRSPQQLILMTLEVTLSDVTIEVNSPVEGDEGRLKKLDDTVQWIRGFQNPFEAYVEKLKEVSSQSYLSPESGLGLARVAYEGQCVLDFYVNESNVLAISAVYQRHRPPAAR